MGAGYPIQVPTIDVAEVGAGGGSMATVDAAGGCQVGPRSAGAVPGPACYGRGGDQPTVTDANLLLGYLNPRTLVGGDLTLDYAKAEAVVAALGSRIGQSTVDTAYGIHLIVNANMMRALSAVSTERGRDPSRFTLVAIGGNGGVHAAGLADTIGIRRFLVPPVAGLFSALGLLFADVEHHLVGAFYRPMANTTLDDFNRSLEPLVSEAQRLLTTEGFTRPAQREIDIHVSMKYAGQTWTLPVSCGKFPADAAQMRALVGEFGEAHNRQYGYRSDKESLHFVAFKVVGRGLPDKPRVPDRVARARERISERSERKAYFGSTHGWLATTVVPRLGLKENAIDGPVIVEEYDCTTLIPPGWRAELDPWNNIVIERT